MRVGSLFSGIGGFDLGLERAGHEIVWQVENEPYSRRVLARHWPDVPCYEDVHDVGAHNLEEVDVICGGFPCQPVSVAGKQRGQDDERWLWPEFARVLRELRPRYALVENVPGLLVHGMGDVLGDLAVLGYDAEWGCVSAASVGAPHLRKRIFIVAHADESGLEGLDGNGSTFTPHSLQANPRPACSPPEGVADALGRHTGRYSEWWPSGLGWWEREPPEALHYARERRGEENVLSIPQSQLGRVVDGVPARVDRLRGLGNAIVPQVAEYIGRRLPSEEG